MVDNELYRSKRDFLRSFTTSRIGQDPGLNKIDDLISRLSPEAKDYLAFLTNTFLEKDILDKTMSDPEEVGKIKAHFNEFGVDPEGTDVLLDIFKKRPD